MWERLVVIGGSLGGMTAVETILRALPASFPWPIAIVLHRSADSRNLLGPALQRHSALKIREPQDKEEIAPGFVYVAPADYHLIAEPGAFALSTEGVVSYARPSLDVLFETAADAFGRAVIGIVLTGANHDGASGARRIKERGGTVIVQQPETAESEIMPAAAIAATKVDHVLPVEEIGPLLVRLSAAKTPRK